MSRPENQHFMHANQSYTLKRYPFHAASQLRAWDAADHYLLSEVEKRLNSANGAKPLCIVNDQFGALTLPMLCHQPLVYSDSWLSFEALRRNIASNGLDNANVTPLYSLEDLAAAPSPALVIGRVPKIKSQLAAMLYHLRQVGLPDCELLLAGMDKHLSRGQFELLARYFGPAEFYPGHKKARVWRARIDPELSRIPPEPKPVHLPEFDLQIESEPNVFSRDHLDIGSRFLLKHLDRIPARHLVADLACGNGVLGLSYMRRHPDAELHFYDESFQAIASTLRNLGTNFPERKALAQAGDGLKTALSADYELVICNPPFHQQTTVSTEVARQLFIDSKRVLRNQGECWVVANRHLAYHRVLKSIFGNCEVLASDHKFVLLQSIN